MMLLPFGISEISKQRIYNGKADVSAIAMLLLVLIGSTCLSYFPR